MGFPLLSPRCKYPTVVIGFNRQREGREHGGCWGTGIVARVRTDYLGGRINPWVAISDLGFRLVRRGTSACPKNT